MRIGIVGAGQMGSGIAQVCATSGLSVQLYDVQATSLEKARSSIGSSLERLEKKGTLAAGAGAQALAKIEFTNKLSGFSNVDFAIEAATENIELKIKIFAELDAILPKESILATNTSSISITRLAAATKRPSLVVGMHFMNPVPIMKLVEGIRGLQTSEATFQKMAELCVQLNKTLVESKKDVPGFIVNRILMPMINEAVFALHEGVATAESIDEAMKLGTAQPMGPLALADFIGLDTCLAILRVLHEGLGEDKYRPCPLLVKYVEAGWLGKKTQRGFYEYR